MIFKQIDKTLATALVIEKHYLHRKCPISWSFGIEHEGGIVGVLTIGKPVAWSAMSSIVGEKYEQFHDPTSRTKDVFELNRLWVDDSLPVHEYHTKSGKCGQHGVESKFIGWVLRYLRKERPNLILFSCADSAQNHVGYVYQSTNWIYAGTTTPFTDIVLEGYEDYRSVPQTLRGGRVYQCKIHGDFPTPYVEQGQPETLPCPVCSGASRRLKLRSWAILTEVIDEKGKTHLVSRKPRSIKHRYLWVANPADRSILAWKEQPYPKKKASNPNSLDAG